MVLESVFVVQGQNTERRGLRKECEYEKKCIFSTNTQSRWHFLQSFASQEGGKELSVDDVIWYLDQKKYAENVSSLEVQDFVQRSVIGQTLLKVSDNSEALPENEWYVLQ